MSSTIMNQQHDLHLSNSNSSNTINIANTNVNDITNVNTNDNDNVNAKSRTRTRIDITSTNSNTNVNVNVNAKTQKSWRSSGWAPLSYPSLALYQYKCNNHANATATADSNAITTANSNANEIELNPFFPLHKDVILAATRELFILDQAIDSSTLQVNVNVNANSNVDIDGHDDRDVHTNNQNGNQYNYPHIRKRKRDGDATAAVSLLLRPDGTATANAATTTTTTDTLAQIIIQETLKLKQQSNVCDSFIEGNTNTLTDPEADPDDNTDSKDNTNSSTNANVISNITAGELSAEALSNLVLQNIIDNLHPGRNGQKDTETDTESRIHASPIAATRTRAMDANSNRIRKVSDAGMDAHFVTFASSTIASIPIPMPVHVTSNLTGWGSGAGSGVRSIQSPYAAHLAVAAINLTGNTINIESSIQQLKHVHIQNSHDEVDADIDAEEDADTIAAAAGDTDLNMHTGMGVDTDEGMQVTEAEVEKNLLLHLQNKHQMPQMLDLSIMVEAYLRKIALEMVYSFRDFVSDKALREFLGYKSPTAKNGRVLELISDFLFDVSHAMFAWEKTEKDMFGNENNITGTVDYKSHDSTICKTLFDSRALRRIGGFEQTSLLSHALSIKRLSAKGVSWATFAKSASGKKMMIHHCDNLSRVQAGAKRRDKRMKKNPYTILDDRDKTRSRTSSIASMESGGSVGINGVDLKISTDLLSYDALMQRQQHRSCISPIVPDLIPIKINRAEGKSWGILLAREGSMCVIMRVPDSTDAQLQRGDLIVSICNENHERVNTPTLHSSNAVSPDWFGNAVGIFKRSNVLHLEVRRVHSAGKIDA